VFLAHIKHRKYFLLCKTHSANKKVEHQELERGKKKIKTLCSSGRIKEQID